MFRINPNLLYVLSDQAPALNCTIVSNIFVNDGRLFCKRPSFIQSETSEEIRKALGHKIGSSIKVFQSGDEVSDEDVGGNKWKGPNKVLGQDG